MPATVQELEADCVTEEMWITEALRREGEVLSGTVSLVPGSDAVSRIRQKLA